MWSFRAEADTAKSDVSSQAGGLPVLVAGWRKASQEGQKSKSLLCLRYFLRCAPPTGLRQLLSSLSRGITETNVAGLLISPSATKFTARQKHKESLLEAKGLQSEQTAGWSEHAMRHVEVFNLWSHWLHQLAHSKLASNDHSI